MAAELFLGATVFWSLRNVILKRISLIYCIPCCCCESSLPYSLKVIEILEYYAIRSD